MPNRLHRSLRSTGVWLAVSASTLGALLLTGFGADAGIAAACLAATVVAGGILFDRLVSKPIEALAGMASSLAAGDLSRRVTISKRAARGLRALETTMTAMAQAMSARQAAADQARAMLAASEAHYRLLVDYATDVVMLIRPDLLPAYVSPSVRDMLGYDSVELAGRDLRGFVHAADQHRWTTALERLLRGAATANATVQMRTGDGNWLWVDASGKRLPGGVGFVFRLHDVHARQTSEAALLEANTHLRVLALQDGLTGLANRRQFDEAVALECRRAQRDGTALAIVMIDLDQFKLFNELYGHCSGDDCLRAVSTAIVGAVQRPADLVARYGGERFAVLLPGTDRTGAAAIGERVRNAVARLELEHAGRQAGLVTVSVGVASTVAGQGLGAVELMQAADRALCEAKRAGRNTVSPGRVQEGNGPDLALTSLN